MEVQRWAQKSWKVTAGVQDRDSKKQIGAGRRVGDLYLLEHLHLPIKPSSTAASSFCLDHKSSPFYIWHSRLGHLSSERLKLLVQAGHLGHISVSDISECSGSKEDLIHIDPFPMDMDVPPEEYTSTLTVSDISTAPSASPRHAPITQVYTRRPTSTAAPQSASTDPDPPVRRIAVRAPPENIPATVKIAMGSWLFEVTLWVEKGPEVLFQPSLGVCKEHQGVVAGSSVGGFFGGGRRRRVEVMRMVQVGLRLEGGTDLVGIQILNHGLLEGLELHSTTLLRVGLWISGPFCLKDLFKSKLDNSEVCMIFDRSSPSLPSSFSFLEGGVGRISEGRLMLADSLSLGDSALVLRERVDEVGCEGRVSELWCGGESVALGGSFGRRRFSMEMGAPGLSGIEGLEATSDSVIEEIQPITQTAIIEQLRSVTDTLATMQQNQSLLMETVLALQKKSTTPPPPQAETEGTHSTGSQTETRDNQTGEGAQNLQSKETPTPPPEISSQKIPSMGVGSAAVVQNTVTQRPSEDLNAYVRRFRELSVDVQEPIAEDRLAKIYVDGMQPAFKPHLVTHHFPDFSALYEAARNLNETMEPPLPPPRYQHSSRGRHPGPRQTAYAASGPPPTRSRGYPAKRPKYNEPPPLPVTAAEAQAFLDAWVQDGKATLPEARKEPTRRDMEHPDYCIYHRIVRHPTKDCWGLRTLFEKFMVEEAVELTATKDVLRNPLPNHKDNGKAVMMVTISHHEENEELTVDRAQANLRVYQQRIARAYDALVRPRQFAEGDLVLKAAPHVMRGKSASKFAAKWEGPFVVKEANENGYYRLSEPDSDILLAPVNAKWLKAYHP
ncbi:hypothetical protein RHGRI_016751 [Rhododendron griersonianum]|uniref:GAG-pre-integrase domain-containing protein n=1 Tax=Rhododendron griersonianum TaxID=479676 RepID=A0AAV6JVB9_9ERIC|nr:hypothetical protein RHGRI_016751 [Rhododendron griersonianum]